MGFILYLCHRVFQNLEKQIIGFCLTFFVCLVQPNIQSKARDRHNEKTMKLRFLLLALLCAGTLSAQAQITTGQPSSKVIRTGNRAQAGDFGLYFGATTNMFKDVFDSDVKLTALPLINLKYMATDRLETRLGLELYNTSEKLSGDVLTGEENETYEMTNKRGSTNFMLYPGVAYHFSKKNLVDVYVGAELPLGWNSEKAIQSVDGTENKCTKTSFVLGLGAFIGIQAYVANLPLAVGLEYGISSRFDTGLKYKNEISDPDGSQTYFTADNSQFKQISSQEQFDNLKARKGQIGGQIRFTVTYYFK